VRPGYSGHSEQVPDCLKPGLASIKAVLSKP
jgi:hypothetical protein